MRKLSQRECEEAVWKFNARFPVGTPGRYWPGFKEGPGDETQIVGEAFLLGGHTPVVSVRAHHGGMCNVALTHFEASEANPQPGFDRAHLGC